MIITDEKKLRIKCEDVLLSESESLIASLEKELFNSKTKGIGLACPQIQISKKAAIVRIDSRLSVNLINCRIEKSYDEFIFKEEGCLSFPGRKEDTKRFNEIYVVDNLVYPHSFTATGLFSVAIQHELDHLNGILLPDRKLFKVVKQKPNEPCLCNSGKKYKKCCYLK